MAFYITIAILSGASVVISRMLNAGLSEKIGVYEATWVNYLAGLAVAAVVVLMVNEATARLALPQNIRQIYMFLGGVTSVGVIAISNIVTLKMSAFVMTVLVFVSQIITGMVIDYFVMGSLSAGKLIGGVVMLAGLAIYQKPASGKKEQASGAS